MTDTVGGVQGFQTPLLGTFDSDGHYSNEVGNFGDTSSLVLNSNGASVSLNHSNALFGAC